MARDAKHEFFVPVLRPTWQVRRDEFDHILLDHAIQQGATHRYGTVQGVLQEGDHIVGVCYVPSQHDAQSASPASKSVRCRVVVDASGRGALLSRFGVAGERVYDAEFSLQVAVFTQFRHARRDPGVMGNNTFLFYGAAHHWAWFIPLSPSLTSVGVVMPGAQVQACGSREAALQWGISQINPDLGWRLEGCEQVETVRAITNYAYAVAPFVGNGWLCVGDAHRFTDPIFSFGVSFAMLEARAASQAIQQVINGEDQREVFADYAAYCDRGQNAAADVIRYFWKFPTFFGYQSRSTLRKDVMRLLVSDFHDVDEMRALQVMRRALHRYRTVA